MRKIKNVAIQALPSLAKIYRHQKWKIQKLLNRYQFKFLNSKNNAQISPFPFIVIRDNPLEKLGDKYKPTKRIHNYLVYYWMHFRDIRLKVESVLEIGVQTDRSIRMWEEFFPNAIIYGIDIDKKCKIFEGERRKILVGDQCDYKFLYKVVNHSEKAFDIIIDDGSHRVEHQLKTFDFLFPAMSEHGIYVIEDTGGCVGDYGLSTVNALKTIIDKIMYWPDEYSPKEWPHLSSFPEDTDWIEKNAIGIAFYRWIVFVMRGRNPEDNHYLTPLS